MLWDICSDFPLEELMRFHESNPELLTVMSTNVMKKVAHAYGQLTFDETTRQLVRFDEKMNPPLSTSIDCGVYLIRAQEFYNSPHFSAILEETESYNRQIEGKNRLFQKIYGDFSQNMMNKVLYSGLRLNELIKILCGMKECNVFSRS
jgi:NDP-sugar pyrophosphorylase family protein